MYERDNRLAYAELERRALDGIENGDVLGRVDGLKRHMLLHIFEKGRYPISYACWTIYQYGHAYETDLTYSVIKARWKWASDMKRAKQTPPSAFRPEPTWVIRQAPLERETVEQKLQNASRIPIPVVGIVGHAGRDGADCGLKWFSNRTGVSLDFWSSGPGEWQPLIKWLYTFTNYLDSELRKAARQRRPNTA